MLAICKIYDATVFLCLCLALSFQIWGSWIFITGMFPMPQQLGSAPKTTELTDGAAQNGEGDIVHERQFGRVVLVVVDALRSQLIFGSHAPQQQSGVRDKDYMPNCEETKGKDADKSTGEGGHTAHPMSYVRSKIKGGKAFAFIADANPPTVTLPRIKSITSGKIPSFQDGLYNFGGDEGSYTDQEDNKRTNVGDNLIDIMVNHGMKVVFYGDDTWLRVFPHHFVRSEGTTSFLVTDFTQVDDNVTRHVWPELENRSDWDVMITHYLGLDHIGHFEGPYSKYMPDKQREMDAIIKRIHETLVVQDREAYIRWSKEHNNTAPQCAMPLPSLLVVCSDHGMADTGGHGGASSPEISTAWVMLSSLWDDSPVCTPSSADGNGAGCTEQWSSFFSLPSKFGKGTPLPLDLDTPEKEELPRRVHQVDIAPTLSLLLGLPIPSESIGVFPPELMQRHHGLLHSQKQQQYATTLRKAQDRDQQQQTGRKITGNQSAGEAYNTTRVLVSLLRRNAVQLHSVLCIASENHCCFPLSSTSYTSNNIVVAKEEHMDTANTVQHCKLLISALEKADKVLWKKQEREHKNQQQVDDTGAQEAAENLEKASEIMQDVLLGLAGAEVLHSRIALAVFIILCAAAIACGPLLVLSVQRGWAPSSPIVASFSATSNKSSGVADPPSEAEEGTTPLGPEPFVRVRPLLRELWRPWRLTEDLLGWVASGRLLWSAATGHVYSPSSAIAAGDTLLYAPSTQLRRGLALSRDKRPTIKKDQSLMQWCKEAARFTCCDVAADRAPEAAILLGSLLFAVSLFGW